MKLLNKTLAPHHMRTAITRIKLGGALLRERQAARKDPQEDYAPLNQPSLAARICAESESTQDSPSRLPPDIRSKGCELWGDSRADHETNFQAWCERGDSNPHPLRDQILSLARLPVPPLSQSCLNNSRWAEESTAGPGSERARWPCPHFSPERFTRSTSTARTLPSPTKAASCSTSKYL